MRLHQVLDKRNCVSTLQNVNSASLSWPYYHCARITPGQNKTTCIVSDGSTISRDELRRFLGMVQYLAKFIPNHRSNAKVAKRYGLEWGCMGFCTANSIDECKEVTVKHTGTRIVESYESKERDFEEVT